MSGVFYISSLVKILMTSFPTFSRLFVQTVTRKLRQRRRRRQRERQKTMGQLLKDSLDGV